RLARLDKLIDAAAAGFGEASVAAPAAGERIRQEVTAAPPSVLAQSPRFLELVQSAGFLPENERLAYARDTLANELGRTAQTSITSVALLDEVNARKAAAASPPRLSEAPAAMHEAFVAPRSEPQSSPAPATQDAALSAPQADIAPSVSAVAPNDHGVARVAQQALAQGAPLGRVRPLVTSAARGLIEPAVAIERLNAAMPAAPLQARADNFASSRQVTTAAPAAEAERTPSEAADVAGTQRRALPASTRGGRAEFPRVVEGVASRASETVVAPRPAGATDTAFEHGLERARAATDTEPSDGEKRAGNYAKGTLDFGGMSIAIESPKGSTRSGTNASGAPWSQVMAHDYGYVKRSEDADGDPVDVFLTGKPDTGQVYVIDQVAEDGRFDEVKAVLGAASAREAEQTYR
ncbi:MAG: hypothetical protein ACREXP_28800, partial [Steroidobacteraceae bacterium]